jgi:hypothetical protein
MSNTETARHGVDRDSLIRDIEAWDRIRDHRTGTAGDHSTDDWLCHALQTAGLTATIDTFDFERLDVHECHVDIASQRIPGVPMFDAGSTGPEPIEGQLGKEILCSTFAPFDAHPTTLATQSVRKESNCRALIAISAGQLPDNQFSVVDGLALVNAESYRKPWGPPVVQVSSEYGDVLRRGASQQEPASVLVDTTRAQATANNIGALIAGRDATARPIVIMTPKSAWWTCTAERMGGICAWLALARHFASNPPRHDILFTANTGHELSHLGLDHFLHSRADLSAEFWLHLGANFASRNSEVRLQASSEPFMRLLSEHLNRQDVGSMHQTPVGTRPAGEARNIYDLGGQYLSILGSNRWFHHPDDRWPNTIDLDRTTVIIRGLISLIDDLANA